MYSLIDLGCFGNNLRNTIFLFSFIREDNRFLYCLYLAWASFSKVTSFNFMYLVSRWFLTDIDFCRPRVIHGFLLNFYFYLEIFLIGAYKSKIELNLFRKLTKNWSTFPLFDLVKLSQSTDRILLIKTGPISFEYIQFCRWCVRENTRSNHIGYTIWGRSMWV